MKEISIMRQLDNPNIVNLYEVYEDDDFIHLVLEYIRGGDLRYIVKLKGFLTEPEAAKVFQQLLLAVNYFHKKKIIHKDVKPRNIMIM